MSFCEYDTTSETNLFCCKDLKDTKNAGKFTVGMHQGNFGERDWR